jgi:hypothetical protein
MTAAQSLSDIVYSYLFPDQMIPIACKNNLTAIDARITEIEVLASGRNFDGSKRAASKLLTEQVVQLRDSLTPPMQWKEIARRMGGKMTTDAARNRYVDYKAAQKAAAMQQEGYAALSGQAIQEGIHTTLPEVQEKIESGDHIPDATKLIQPETASSAQLVEPDQLVQEATIRNSRIVQEILEDKRDLTTKQAGYINGPKIPHSEDEPILQLRAEGKLFREIHEALQAKGIICTLDDVTARYHSEKKKREKAKGTATVKPQATPDPSLPGVEGAQKEARANPRGPSEEEQQATPKPNPKLDYDEIADAKIINMKKRGLLNHEIAQVLERNPGGSWDVQKVDARWTELKRQGLA